MRLRRSAVRVCHAGPDRGPDAARRPPCRPAGPGAFRKILEVGLSLGGTVTGEHGIGKIKQDWLAREIGPVGLDVHRRIKAALDPHNLFNPGSMFDVT